MHSWNCRRKIDEQKLTGADKAEFLKPDATERVSGAEVWRARSGAAGESDVFHPPVIEREYAHPNASDANVEPHWLNGAL